MYRCIHIPYFRDIHLDIRTSKKLVNIKIRGRAGPLNRFQNWLKLAIKYIDGMVLLRGNVSEPLIVASAKNEGFLGNISILQISSTNCCGGESFR